MFDISKELQSEIRRYSAHIAYEIRNKQKREAVKQELIEYFEDAIYDRMIRLGLSEREAFKEACAELGSVDKPPVLDGRFMSMVIAPIKKK